MKKVITYGSFDLFHEGHRRIIERAKALGDYLIVGVTTEHYDETRGKINIRDPLMKRIENIYNTGLVDEIIIESSAGQKLEDVQKYNIDIFTVGSDWIGAFDYLKEFCDVVYLERTKGISSTELRDNSILRMGIMGANQKAEYFTRESKFVSGVNLEAIYDENLEKVEERGTVLQLKKATHSIEAFFEEIDCVYINAPVEQHGELITQCLLHGKHVLCAAPLTNSKQEAETLFALAEEKQLILMEDITTAYCAGFSQLVALAKSGKIGRILDVNLRYYEKSEEEETSLLQQISTPLLPILKLLGDAPTRAWGEIFRENGDENADTNADETQGKDQYLKFHLSYPQATATATIMVKETSLAQMRITGTTGEIVVDSPWWRAETFQFLPFRESVIETQAEKYFFKFSGVGLRYSLSEFVSVVIDQDKSNFKLKRSEVVALSSMEEMVLKNIEIKQ